MAEKPIFFNGEMVRAILDGRKTQTRRPVRPQPPDNFWPHGVGKYHPLRVGTDGLEYPAPERFGVYDDQSDYPSPYAPGDILYVRESYAPNYFGAGKHGYRADWTSEAADVVPEPKWTPSIHMRKQDARIWLRVTDVRVERVKDITAESAMVEGAQRFEGLPPSFMGTTGAKWSMGSPKNHGECLGSARMAFANVWCATYGHDSWDRNDWVWVYEFEHVEAPR